MLTQMLPLDAGKSHETLRRHTLRTGEEIRNRATPKLETAASAIDTSLDSTFIRSCEDGERHLEVMVGNVETAAGARRVFGAVAKSGTGIKEQIRGSLDALGRTADTALTGFTDGCSGLRRILADVGVTEAPILDWFHIAMRLRHLKQVADGLSADDSERAAAKAVIIEEVDRLNWRLWNGKALQALNGYLTGQSDWMVHYAERHRAGLRVGTAITEGTANFMVNHRMEKSQSMRWSRRGADLLLQVRCAVYNGTLGSGFGQRFYPANDLHPQAAIAA